MSILPSRLSYILPVWKASEILGEAVVRRMVITLLQLRASLQSASNSTNSLPPYSPHDVELLVQALLYRPPEEQQLEQQEENKQLEEEQEQDKKLQEEQQVKKEQEEDPEKFKDENDDSETTPRKQLGGLHEQEQAPRQQQQPDPEVAVLEKVGRRFLTSRALLLEKPLWLAYLVPANLQPHSGPAGHQGLFDCWLYALQQQSPSHACGSCCFDFVRMNVAMWSQLNWVLNTWHRACRVPHTESKSYLSNRWE